MRLFLRAALVILGCALLAAAQQPAIYTNGIVNAASFSPVGLPNSAIAQGSIFTIFGTNLGPAQSPALSFPLPDQQGLGGVTVQINPTTGGGSYYAIMLFVSPGQVSAIMPSKVPTGTANVVLTYNGKVTQPQQVTVTDRSFGAFALNQAGSGPGVMQDFIDPATQPFNMVSESAQPGQVIVLWGTGLGRVSFDETRAPVPGDMRQGVEVWVGGKQAAVQYAGRSSCCAGVDQVNFVVPPGLNGCYVPVTVKTGTGVSTVMSNYVSMAVAASRGVCSDQISSLSGLDPTRLANNGLSQGLIALNRVSLTALGTSISTDTASGTFAKYDYNSLVRSHGTAGVSQIGACVVFTFKGDQTSFADPIVPAGLDAGPQLTLSGPGGSKTLTPAPGQKGNYSIAATPGFGAPWLVPGAYTISGPGGADVGSFSTSITVPTPFTPNLDQAQIITRTQPLTVSWSGGAAQDLASVIGFSEKNSVGAGFVCLGKISDTQLVVPPEVLLALPAAGANDTTAIMASEVSLPISFKPSGLDQGQLTYTMSNMKIGVTYQ